ncbi:sulfotransferase family 2 domain-containing protein [Pelagibacterales bacterium SAG-MED49]|nr:sulfotransferase family 2 domain-containing protein [Pelagibacterales bacterium SAG-MED49]
MIIAEKKIRAIEIDILKCFYCPVPKNGSTSFKHLNFFLNYNQMFKDTKISEIIHIHTLYPSQRYMKPYNSLQAHFKLNFLNYHSLFTTRDPIERFISGFNDRVLFHNKLELNYSSNFDKLNFFFDNFDKLLLENMDINWHFATQHSFLDIYKKRYKKITFIKLNQIREYLLNNTKGLLKNRVVKFYDNEEYYFNSSKSRKIHSQIKIEDLNDEQKHFINIFYKKDFSLNL